MSESKIKGVSHENAKILVQDIQRGGFGLRIHNKFDAERGYGPRR